MRRIIPILTIITLLFCISSCEKEDDISKLKVSTIDVKKTTYLTVSITGSVSGPSSIIDNAEIGIQISTDEVFGAALSYRQSMDNNDDHNGYSVTVSNLKQGVTYYYRAYCAYQSGFYYGETKTFCFNWDGPKVTTLSANFDSNGGIEFVGYIDELGKTLNNMGGYNANTSFGFECSPNSDFDKDSTIILEPDKYYPFLGDSVIWYYYEYQFGKKYYYRSFFKYDSEIYYGDIKTFNTPLLEITTGIFDTISYTITCYKNEVSIEGRNVSFGICYNQTGQPTLNDSVVISQTIDNNQFTIISPFEKSSIGDKFYFRAYILIDGIPYYGKEETYIRCVLSGGFEYVDLGLSVLWATYNIGASTPEEYGSYYSWGDIETKSRYSWYDYRFCGGFYGYQGDYSLRKYNTLDYMFMGSFDNKTTLELEDDAAHVIWGGDWRTPTSAEFSELLNEENCEWTWTNQNGVNGYLITSKINGFEGHSIFLPAAGSRNDNAYQTILSGAGTNLAYWSSSLDFQQPFQAIILSINGNNLVKGACIQKVSRESGRTIRPVCPSTRWIDNVDKMEINLDKESISLIPNSHITLNLKTKIDGELISCPVSWKSSNNTIVTVDDNGLVTGISVGSAIITAIINNKSCSCLVQVNEPQIIKEAIDLGLSVKWATCNYGAEKPEDCGCFLAWGEKSTKIKYSLDTYQFNNSSYGTIYMTKYCTNSNYGNNDSRVVLSPDDDIAYEKWGENWRIPSKEEFQELIDSCSWSWTNLNGTDGYLVTSNINGYKDKSIFLPISGCRSNYQLNSVGAYWTNSINTDAPYCAWDLIFEQNNIDLLYTYRYGGLTIRPVSP